MYVVMAYGLIALAVMSITLAAKTRSVWKLGILFFTNWVLYNSFNFLVGFPSDWVFFVILDSVCGWIALSVQVKYHCTTSEFSKMLYFACVPLHLIYGLTGDYTSYIHSMNGLYIAHAMMLTWISLAKIIRRDRRVDNLGPSDAERRNNPFFYDNLIKRPRE